jgi:hypothetical protein
MTSRGTDRPFCFATRISVHYPGSSKKSKLVIPGEITRYDLTGFNWFSRPIKKRLLITCPNDEGFEKNYLSAGPNESVNHASSARISSHHTINIKAFGRSGRRR